jgi:sulfur carrier protein
MYFEKLPKHRVASFLLIGGVKVVTINGKEVDMSGKTISQYLEIANYNPKTIAVECNEVIISKSDYETTVLKDGDVVEVVSFMGGG